MPEEVIVRAAVPADVEAIVAVLRANLADPSLFQRSAAEITAQLSEYLIAAERAGAIVGCAALHCYPDQSAELHSVAVLPERQGRRIGELLVQTGLQQAAKSGVAKVWLGTMKPGYFARFGFVPMWRWRIPLSIMLPKIKSVFSQPPARWLPALLGSHTFMVRQERS
jgi:amino-acid N-acetyltransferase